MRIHHLGGIGVFGAKNLRLNPPYSVRFFAPLAGSGLQHEPAESRTFTQRYSL